MMFNPLINGWTFSGGVFTDTVLNFIRNHPLMDEAVSHENGVPVFYKGDVAFTSLVVERLKIEGFTDDKYYTVYYAGTGKRFLH